MVKIIKYNKGKIYHAIYIRFFYFGTVYYLKVYTDDVLNTTNNETKFPELTRFFKKHFEIKFQEGSVLKYLNLWTFQSTLDFSVDQTDKITELVKEWFPTGKFRKFGTPFSTDSTYEK